MPRLTEVRKNAINTFDADYATMCHRLNEPDEQVPSSNQPHCVDKSTHWDGNEKTNTTKKTCLASRKTLGKPLFPTRTTTTTTTTTNVGKVGNGSTIGAKGRTNPITSATTISLGAEREAKEARVAKRTTIRTDKLDWSYLARGILARANQHTRDENVRSGRRNNAPERTVTWPTNHTSTISAEWERKNKPTLLKPKLRINNADTTTPTT